MPKENNFQIDFLGIAAPRSGTTWIAECLREHPEICLSSPKETYFFGTDKYEKFGLKWYQKHFHCKPNQIKGEYDAGYFLSEKAAKQIKKHFPEIKLIACLRNPAERAFSNYLSAQSSSKKTKGFLEIIKENPQTLERGLYYKHLKKYFELFPKENILINIYEDIEKKPKSFIKKIYRFLEVNENFIPKKINQKSNISKKYRVPFIKKIAGKTIKKLENSNYGVNILNFFRKIGLKKCFLFFEKLNSKKFNQKPTISSEAKQYLKNYYLEDIKNLEKLINRDLSHWK